MIQLRRSNVLRLLVCASAMAGSACSDGATSPEGSPTTGGPCADLDRLQGAICLEEVTGSVVDENGRPIPDLAVTVCGPVCHRGVTDQAGVFAVKIEGFVIASEYSVQAHGTPTKSTFYHPIPADTEDGNYVAGVLRVLDLVEEGPLLVTKLELDGNEAPAQVVTSGPMTLSIPAGTVVRVSVADSLSGDEGRRFRAREVEPEWWDEYAPGLEISRLFALGPFEAEFQVEGASVSLSIENNSEWSAGTAVPIFALGTYLDPEWLTPSAFEQIGTGVVADDGASIELAMDPTDPGLRHLTWLALGLPHCD